MRRIATAAFLLASVVGGYAEAQNRVGEGPTEFTPAQKTALASLPRNNGAANPPLEMVREESQRIVGTLQGSLTTPSMAVDTWVVVVPKVPMYAWDAAKLLAQSRAPAFGKLLDHGTLSQSRIDVWPRS
ncbi:hypothetical protein [Novipirellula caenicola]|uniref:Uncharacterized protein n=1 Tax=Novipirellula caenicola TaxID=1536901 RepID=A0ABP9VS11_9BACT